MFLKEINMGQRASDTRGITFEEVRVPKEVKKLNKKKINLLIKIKD